jgi:hypothetical protein
MTNEEIMAMSNQELDARREARAEESRKEYEFAKFKVKMDMTADQIREAVYEYEYELARDNKDWLYDLVVAYYENQKMSDEEYLDMYMDYVYQEEEHQDILNKEIVNE